MSGAWRQVSRPTLLAVAHGIRSGRLTTPWSRVAVGALVPPEHRDVVVVELQSMTAEGMAPTHIARLLEAVAAEREAAQRLQDRVSFVWSPPDYDEVDARDTAVVVQDLFQRATRSVLIATYALDEGPKAHALFGRLAARMDADPALQVRIFANVHRPHRDETPSADLLRQFAARLRASVWPGTRLPEMYYDPRSLELEGPKRAVLHAKCIVIDRRLTFLTSANFTEAAQERNIEAGLLVDDETLAARVERQFEGLVGKGRVRGEWV